MLVTMKRNEFESLDSIPLIWACIEPTIRNVRGKNLAIKSEAYSQLTEGQQALLMFQILYGHTVSHGVSEFLFYQTYMLSNKGAFTQLIDGMMYFEASAMVQFLYELYTTYEKFCKEIELGSNIDKGTPLFTALTRLDEHLKGILPSTIDLVSSHIRKSKEQFVRLED